MSGTCKVLIAGPCQGKLATLMKRVSTVNQKNGPFDVLFCLGPFFDSTGTVDDAGAEAQLTALLADPDAIPLPTYFIGAWGAAADAVLRTLITSTHPKLHYLGRAGVQQVQGLTVAYLDGSYSKSHFSTPPAADSLTCQHYTQEDVAVLQSALENTSADVDFLLTNDWPEGVAAGQPDALRPEGLTMLGSAVVAELAEKARPRYHVAAGKELFFARLPYANRDIGAGPLATRFLGLASVGNAKKEKFIHALQVTPAAKMDAVQLVALPEGCTPSPFEVAAAQRKRDAAAAADAEGFSQGWRWQDGRAKRPRSDHASGGTLRNPGVVVDNRKSVLMRNLPFKAVDDDIVAFFAGVGTVVDIRRGQHDGRPNSFAYVQFDTEDAAERALNRSGDELMGRPIELSLSAAAVEAGGKLGKPVEGCWFCLSNDGADIDLVVSVGEECYLALDKGPVDDTHVLLLPIEHYPSLVSLPQPAFDEAERYLAALATAYAAQGKKLLAFERYASMRKVGGNHCHVNVLAVDAGQAGRVRQVFEAKAHAHGFEFEHVPHASGAALRSQLRSLVGDGEYLLVVLPGEEGLLVYPVLRGVRLSLQLGREALAEVAGDPVRADWKACVVDEEQERARTAAFKERFKPFDIMQ